MAKRHINVANGLVALPTGANGVFNAMDINETYAAEDTTVFGSGLVYGTKLTNGTPIQDVSVTGFANDGAATTTPGFGAMTAAGGGAATLTIDTGTTIAGNYVVTGIRTSVDRRRAGAPTVWSLASSGEITTTWVAT